MTDTTCRLDCWYCRVNFGYGKNDYACFTCDQSKNCDHQITWWYLILPELLIGLSCLLVGLRDRNQISIDNKQINTDYQLTKVYSNHTSNQTEIITVTIDNNCVPTNNFSLLACNYVLENKNTTVNQCYITSSCVNTTCGICYSICHTKQCWIPEQQQVCYEKMTQLGCRSNFNYYTTYICNTDPSLIIPYCVSDCSDFTCKNYGNTCNCICNAYGRNICNVIISRQHMKYTTIHWYYEINNKTYILEKQYLTCDTTDTICLNSMNNTIITSRGSIYYDKNKPYNTVLSLESLYVASTHRIFSLICAGIFFTSFAVFFFLIELYIFLTYCERIKPIENKFGIDTCSICLTNINKKVFKSLPCNHVFHTVCIDEWLSRKAICPLCNHEVKV